MVSSSNTRLRLQLPTVRRRHEGKVVRFDFRAAGERDAKASAVISYAKRVKDFTLLEEAVDAKLREQQQFVEWWRSHVSVNHGPGRGKKNALPRSFSVAQAEIASGIKQQLVSKWSQRLEDPERYRARLLGPMVKTAMGGADGRWANFTHSCEYHTPKVYIEAAREVMGGIDIDPATCAKAQKTVRAARWFTKDDDGLAHPWNGRVWLNPPYAAALLNEFVDKLLHEVDHNRVTQAIVLVDNRTDARWFDKLVSRCNRLCFTTGRIKFIGANQVISIGSTGSSFLYFGDHVDQFDKVFAQFGFGVSLVFPSSKRRRGGD